MLLFFLLASSFAAAAAAVTLVLFRGFVGDLVGGFCAGFVGCDLLGGDGFCWVGFGVTVAVLLGLALRFLRFVGWGLVVFGSSSSSEE